MGLAVAIVTGFALFGVQPFDDLAHPQALPVKLASICLAAANALLAHRTASWRALITGGPVTARLRVSAVLSLVGRDGAVLAGRLLAF